MNISDQNQKTEIDKVTMYQSEFANSLSNIKDVTDLSAEKMEEENSWLNHDQFRDLLNKREQTIRRSSSTIGLHNSYHRPDSPRPSIIPRMSTSHISRLHMATKPDIDIGNREELERLEVENMRLRRQLESISKGEMADSKYASLASEVVRLQDSVSQVKLTLFNQVLEKEISPSDGAHEGVL